MKKFSILVLCLIVMSLFLSACTTTTKSPIKYERKLGKYFQNENTPQGEMIDLSEGPRLNYDGNLGPKDLNFEMKLITPY